MLFDYFFMLFFGLLKRWMVRFVIVGFAISSYFFIVLRFWMNGVVSICCFYLKWRKIGWFDC